MKSRCPEGQDAREIINRPKAFLKRRLRSDGGVVAPCQLKTCQIARQNANSPSSPREGGLGGRSISAECMVKKKLDVFDRQKEFQYWFFVLTCACLSVFGCLPVPPAMPGTCRSFALFSFWFASGIRVFQLLGRSGFWAF